MSLSTELTQCPSSLGFTASRAQAEPSKPKFMDLAYNHTIGRISAAAQIPFHMVALIAQAIKIAFIYPVCAYKDWYSASNVKISHQTSQYGSFSIEGFDEVEAQVYTRPNHKDSVERAANAANMLMIRIGQNFTDLLCGSSQNSSTLQEAVVDMFRVPLTNIFSNYHCSVIVLDDVEGDDDSFSFEDPDAPAVPQTGRADSDRIRPITIADYDRAREAFRAGEGTMTWEDIVRLENIAMDNLHCHSDERVTKDPNGNLFWLGRSFSNE